MTRVQVAVEPQMLARAASGAPGLSIDAVVHQALQEYALRHVLRARAHEDARRLGPPPAAGPRRVPAR
ncbi:MAG: hypothetical protein NDJ94_07790 [Vicinamibacteria bacterium]|nr:hypothetical protein [Vicinamibacteria bacterium]